MKHKREEVVFTPYLATCYVEGFGQGARASKKDKIRAWQYLVDTGLAFKMQGWFGREAMRLAEKGIIKLPKM